jgi:hypothetical protein
VSNGKWRSGSWSYAQNKKVRLTKGETQIVGILRINDDDSIYTIEDVVAAPIRIPYPGTFKLEVWEEPKTAKDYPLFSRAVSISAKDKGVVKIEENSWVRVGGGDTQRSKMVSVLRDAEVDLEYNIIHTPEGERL